MDVEIVLGPCQLRAVHVCTSCCILYDISTGIHPCYQYYDINLAIYVSVHNVSGHWRCWIPCIYVVHKENIRCGKS